MPHSIDLHVNGKAVILRVDDLNQPLLYSLRNELDLQEAKFGCGLGQCGTCTVHIDGEAVRSCITPLSALSRNQQIVTLEGLGSAQKPHPLRQAFIGSQAMRCGYCLNGMIMQSAALILRTERPSAAEIRGALAHNFCRCGIQARMVRTIERALAKISAIPLTIAG